MGGYGFGGRNRTHGCEERQLYKADSLKITDRIRYDKYFWFKDEVKIHTGGTHILYYPELHEAEICENGTYYPLELSKVDNIDGLTYRLYFYCPYCGERVRYLYRNSCRVLCVQEVFPAELPITTAKRYGLDTV